MILILSLALIATGESVITMNDGNIYIIYIPPILQLLYSNDALIIEAELFVRNR